MSADAMAPSDESQYHSGARDVVPLHLPDSLTTLRGLRELGVSMPEWHYVIGNLTGLTRLMVRFLQLTTCLDSNYE